MNFFIDDSTRIAEYIKSHYPDEAAKTIQNADEIVAQRFLFNLRWDMERTYEPVIFKDSIDWLYQPGDDPEWVFAFNRMHFWICLGQAYALTRNEKYARTFGSQLISWVETVKRDDPKCNKAWRSIEAGIRMEYWCKAMAYFKGSPSITEDVMNRFNESMTDHAEFIMTVWNSYNLMSNWGILANHGLFIASVMLPQSEKTLKWREESLKRLAKEIEIQVYDDGTQWEQSPMYHNEVAHDFLDVIILARRNNIVLPEIIERKTKDMCYVNLWWTKPDGNQICMGDSDEIDTRDITTKGAYLFQDRVLKAGAYRELDFDCVWDLGFGAVSEYAELESASPSESIHSLTDSGNYFYRSDWTENASFLHFHCGTLGAGHGHSDQLHIDLFAKGEDILIDPGRFTYVAGKERYEFKDSTAHNTCTVDDRNFYQCKDSWECSKLSRPVNRNHASKRGYTLFEGGHLGYYDLGREGVFVNRKVITLAPDLFVIADEFYTGGTHSYQNRLHFNNRGEVRLQGNRFQYSSDKNTVNFTQISSYGNIEISLEGSRLSRHYNMAEESVTVQSRLQAEGFASLFTVISLDSSAEVEKVSVRSNFKDIIFENRMIEALNIVRATTNHTLVVAHQEYASPTDTFNADGCTGFGQVVVFDRSKNEREIGTVLQW